MVPADGVLVNSLEEGFFEDALESLHENEHLEQLPLWSKPLKFGPMLRGVTWPTTGVKMLLELDYSHSMHMDLPEVPRAELAASGH